MRYQHVRMEMKVTSKTYVHETMHVNNKVEMNKACLTYVHRRERNCNMALKEASSKAGFQKLAIYHGILAI